MSDGKTYISLILNSVFSKKLKDLVSWSGKKKTEVIKDGIDLNYEAMNKKRFGYRGSDASGPNEPKDQSITALIRELNGLSDDDLTKRLLEAGYLNPRGPLPGMPGFFVWSVAKTDTNGVRMIYQNLSKSEDESVPPFSSKELKPFSAILKEIKDGTTIL